MKNFYQKVLDSFQTKTDVSDPVLKEKLGIFYNYAKMLEKLQTQAPIQARLPFNFETY